MDETLLRRLVGLVTLAILAFLLSWLLPRPGLQRLEGERVVTMDLTRADSQPQEQPEVATETESPTAPMPAAQPSAPQPNPDPDEGQSTAPPANAEADAPEVARSAPTEATTSRAAPPGPDRVEPSVAKSEPAKPPSRPAPAPAAVEHKPEAAPPKATPRAAYSAGAVVQAGAYSFLDKAQTVVARAASAGVSCVVSPADTAKGTLYRVRCGPYPARDQADAAVRSLSAASIAAQVVPGGAR